MTKRNNIIMLGFVSVLLCSVFGYMSGITFKTKMQNSEEYNKNKAPVNSITTTIQTNQQELLFDQLRQFAEKNFFAIRFRNLQSLYVIEMWREDIQIFSSFEVDAGILSLSFDHNQFEQPVFPPISLKVFDELKNDLESRIITIPNAIVTEKYRQLVITTDKNWRNEELLVQMKAFADKHSLEYKLSFFDFDPTEKKCFDVEIRGEGFHITSRDCSEDTIEEVNFDFFLDKYKNSPGTAQATLDKLFYEFKGLLSNVQNALVIEQP